MLETLIETTRSAMVWLDSDQTVAPILFWLGLIIFFLAIIIADLRRSGRDNRKRRRFNVEL